jgi:hypothetical protein
MNQVKAAVAVLEVVGSSLCAAGRWLMDKGELGGDHDEWSWQKRWDNEWDIAEIRVYQEKPPTEPGPDFDFDGMDDE